jgi:hypothetical protein
MGRADAFRGDTPHPHRMGEAAQRKRDLGVGAEGFTAIGWSNGTSRDTISIGCSTKIASLE